mmetsp:Transcript_72602/g.212955  ORF Transcript_72602/g.212955 Transcript_72602/m.212955 type:complete len:374 (+) Transcript_72602:77-1198(+)
MPCQVRSSDELIQLIVRGAHARGLRPGPSSPQEMPTSPKTKTCTSADFPNSRDLLTSVGEGDGEDNSDSESSSEEEDFRDDISVCSDVDQEQAPEVAGADGASRPPEGIFNNAIAVAQLVEAAMLIPLELPSEQLEFFQASAAKAVARIIVKLQASAAEAGGAPLADDASCSDLQRVVRLLRSMKLMFDEESATARVQAAINRLEERFDRAYCFDPREEEELERTSEQIALQAGAECACRELSSVAALLLPRIPHPFVRMSASAGHDDGKVLMAKVLSCAKLVEATFRLTVALDAPGCSAVGHEQAVLISEELRRLSSELPADVRFGGAPKEPASGKHGTVLNLAIGIAEAVEDCERCPGPHHQACGGRPPSV